MIIKKILTKPFLFLSIGLAIGYYTGGGTSTRNTKMVLKETGISEKVNKATVTNEIEFRENKFKKTDSININIGQEPINIITSDTCIDITNYKDWQKKKIQKWDKNKK